jgi:AcrR family transcriptional regulator
MQPYSYRVSRPSRNVDEKLLRAGRELFPETGCAGLTVRKVAERAGVNPGMFHYHFGAKDAFVRALLQGIYDEMFATLSVAAGAPGRPVEALSAALQVLARFAREQRAVVRRIVADAMDGHEVAREFLRTNVPRHLEVIVGLIATGQRAGALKPLAIPQAVVFLAGAVGAPVLVVGGMIDGAIVSAKAGRRLQADVLSDAAIGERIDLALSALATPPRRAR